MSDPLRSGILRGLDSFDGEIRDPERIQRTIETIDSIFKQGFMRRAEAELVMARELGCGFTVTYANGGYATAQITADPEVPHGYAHIHEFDKREGKVVSVRNR